MKRRSGYNPKRALQSRRHWSPEEKDRRARAVSYGGNPEHKVRPNDYGLTPPVNPRPGKAVCDGDGPFPKDRAEQLVRAAMRKGMVSVQERGEWPQNVWAVSRGEAFEAQLENSEQGVYHGYPMALDDPFRDVVLREWRLR